MQKLPDQGRVIYHLPIYQMQNSPVLQVFPLHFHQKGEPERPAGLYPQLQKGKEERGLNQLHKSPAFQCQPDAGDFCQSHSSGKNPCIWRRNCKI